MGQAIADMLTHTAHTMDFWIGLIAGLPFPVWCALMVIGVLYVLEKNHVV